MSWFAICGSDENWIAPEALEQAESLLTRGSILVETRYPQSNNARPLVLFESDDDWPFQLAIHALPGGAISFSLDQGGEVLHKVFNCTETGRGDILRLTYTWDGPLRQGRLAFEKPDHGQTAVVPFDSPSPIPLWHMHRLMQGGEGRYLSPEVIFMAASSEIEPVGPLPTLMADTPVATPYGYRPVQDLKRGDLVISGSGDSVPVLHNVTRILPARGSFAPIRLCAPYFGLGQDIDVSPMQRLVLSGSEVEYLFGHESVLVQAGHLAGGPAVQRPALPRFVSYAQPILPQQETLNVAGTIAESLYVGRLRRKPLNLAASALATLDRGTLPEHPPSARPVLKSLDAITLAAYRAA